MNQRAVIGQYNPGVYSAAELEELSVHLSLIEDWLRDDCTARHHEDMADTVRKAWEIIDDLYDDLYDDQERRESGHQESGPGS